MKAEFARICAVLLGLVVCAAAQDVSPSLMGAKPPFLLAFGCLTGIPSAICAGLFADALGGLPFGCSAIFFAVAAFASRMVKSLSAAVIVFAAGVYQMWIILWGYGFTTIQTIIGAMLSGVVVVPMACAAIQLARRRIGLDVDREGDLG